MGINVPLLRKTLEHITAHPAEHNQATWAMRTSCGTACCLAGWAVQFAGHELTFDDPASPDGRHTSLAVDANTGDVRNIAQLAADELGLTQAQRVRLFDSVNSLGALYALANRFTDGEISIPEDVRVPDYLL